MLDNIELLHLGIDDEPSRDIVRVAIDYHHYITISTIMDRRHVTAVCRAVKYEVISVDCSA
jgi:hypothetical protein